MIPPFGSFFGFRSGIWPSLAIFFLTLCDVLFISVLLVTCRCLVVLAQRGTVRNVGQGNAETRFF